MAKGYGGGFTGGGGMNMNSLIKQAQKMQKQLEEEQERLKDKTIETSSGGGAVKVVVTGQRQIKEITIKPEVVDPDDVEMLQDLIMTAVNEAMRQAGEMAAASMGGLTGGMNIPGMF